MSKAKKQKATDDGREELIQSLCEAARNALALLRDLEILYNDNSERWEESEQLELALEDLDEYDPVE